VRVERLRALNLGVTLAWCALWALALSGYALLAAIRYPAGAWPKTSGVSPRWAIGVTGIYLSVIGAVLQAFSQPRAVAKTRETQKA
jgi:hypothetical protein